jgi:Family of unknown function (DUF6152)
MPYSCQRHKQREATSFPPAIELGIEDMKFESLKYLWVLAAVLVMPAYAHHSFAMFDFNKTVTFKATVKEFRWTNPHVVLLVEGSPTAGTPPEVWSMELTSPGNLTRMGWSRRSFKPGDAIELQFNPLRDGKHGGAFKEAKLLETGQVLTSSVRDFQNAEKPGLQ